MNAPLVSVIVPCYNAAATVSETLASVQAQGVSDFEIIAVDNNSTDGTLDVLRNIAFSEPRLKVVQQARQGISPTRNYGISLAQGQFIAFLDSDDLWDTDYLATHLATLADEGVSISYSRIRLIDMAGRPTGSITQPKLTGLQASDMLRSNPCAGVLFVVRASVFERVGVFDEELRSVEDQEWLFRAVTGGARMEGIGRPIASYRSSPDGLSADLETMLACHEQLLDRAEAMAPEVVRPQRRFAQAAMLGYCARRAIEHNKGVVAARTYLWRMVRRAPDLLVREPVASWKIVARVILADLQSMLGWGRGPAARTEVT